MGNTEESNPTNSRSASNTNIEATEIPEQPKPAINPKYLDSKQDVEMSEIDYIKKTQTILQKIFSRPPLKSKFLARPPIRFLLDVCRSIKKETDFFDTIPAETFNGKKFKTLKGPQKKKFQESFLKKIIEYVEISAGVKLNATIKSISEGSQPEATNELLQLIGNLATGQYIAPSNTNTEPIPQQNSTPIIEEPTTTKPVAKEVPEKDSKQPKKKEEKAKKGKEKNKEKPSRSKSKNKELSKNKKESKQSKKK